MSTDALVTPMSGEQRRLVQAMLTRLPEFAERLAQLLSQADACYREVDSSTPDELRQVCRANLERALRSFVDGDGPALDAARRTGLAQARQGIPLPAVLRAFRLGGTFVHEALLDLAGPGMITSSRSREINAGVWRAIDLYSEAATAAYDDVSAELPRAHAERLEDLLQGRLSTPAELESAARELGLSPTGTYVVAVAEHTERPAIEASLRSRRWCSVWRPAADAGIIVLDRVDDLRRLREDLATLPLAAGLSRPVNGLGGIPDAVHRARIARRTLPAGTTGAAIFGDPPVTTLVAAAPPAAREAARSLLSGVLTLAGPERKVLLDTLLAWYAGQGSAKAAADRLFVHPNTVRYRLRRLQELTHRDLSDPVDTAELYVALQAVRLEPPPE